MKPKNPPKDILAHIRRYYSYENGKILSSMFSYKEDGIGHYNASKGRTVISIKSNITGKLHTLNFAHVVWYLCENEWPKEQIDHIDRNPLNNDISNLRYADQSLQNSNKIVSNKHKLRGVNKVAPTTYQAQIWYKGVRYLLGTFSTAEEAHKAYRAKYKELHGIEFEQ